MRDCVALWRVFLATFGILPVLAAPMSRCQLAGRLAITPMPSSKAAPARWVALFDGHLGISVADSLALTTLASPDYELLWSSRGTPWAVAW